MRDHSGHGSQNQADARASAVIDELSAVAGDDNAHPLADVLDFLADQVGEWEAAHVAIPDVAPSEVLRFLMEQHGLKQDDLTDCAPQGRISDYLAERREISKTAAKLLASRFNVRVDLFL